MTLTLHKSQVHCFGNYGYELAVHWIRFFACRGRLRNWGAICSIIGLCYVTITWSQIFEDALEVTVVGTLPHMTIERR